MDDEGVQARKLRIELSNSHRRAITARLRVLEENCSKLLELFHAESHSLSERQALPEEFAKGIRECSARLRVIIADLKADLDLEPEQVDPLRVARALASIMTVGIEELRPEDLKGYGPVPDPLASYLEPHLEVMLGIMNRMNRALAKPTEVQTRGS